MRLIPNQLAFLLLATILSGSCSRTTKNFDSFSKLPEQIDFNFHIRPILADRCFKCHGPDENTREANLRLDLEEHAFAPLDTSGERFAIVPGDVHKSELISRINSEDPADIMPPLNSKLELSDDEKEMLKRWIAQGAEWKAHWSFIPPQEVVIPEISQPDWPRNPVDHFILRRLDQAGLRPAPEANKEKLIRRLSFDLRGLPPSLEEIDAFLADESPDAYAKVVDKFLSGSDFGERLALEWLDVARYADSHGYQDDIERSMWPWRDWVIQAFNRNMPYDQFVIWQLAGDLMPDASYEQILATGFNRNHKITQEVGVIDEEYRVEYVLDRVNTFSTAFLGLTVACAQCHDHKFDPISQKEYYSLFSFFNHVPEKGRVEYNVEVAEPSLPLPEEKVEEHRNYIRRLVTDQQRKVNAYEDAQAGHESVTENLTVASTAMSTDAPLGLNAYYPMDYIGNNSVYEVARGGRKGRVVHGLVPIPGKFSGGLEFSGNNYLDLGAAARVHFHRPFSVSFWIYSIHGGIRGPVITAYRESKNKQPVFELSVNGDKTLRLILRGRGPESAIAVKTREEIPPDHWGQVTVTYDGSGRAEGVKFFLDGELLEGIVLQDDLIGSAGRQQLLLIGGYDRKNPEEFVTNGLRSARLDELMFFERNLSSEAVQHLVSYNPLQELLTKTNRNESETKRLFYHQLHHADEQYRQLTTRLGEYKIRQVRAEAVGLKPTMIMADMDTLRPTYILERGQYNAPTERVTAGTPKYILPFPADYPKNRLGLAQWLFDEKNPLTARVAVNRYWQMIFGRGLVATPEDFGSQGDLPSHPELLDWLAREFRQSDWNVKHLLKTLVMSATYRQSVALTPELEEKDPDNVLLARGPQLRLPAEIIRDHALAISGLLSRKVGGPSVKPYQPKGLWLQAASGNQPLRNYIQGHDEDLYRKSMYTFWKRTVPPPSMITFDAATREQCSVRRQNTNTPMQALVLLNDPQFVEASRLIAVRMLVEGGENPEERIRFAFRLATSRAPGDEELALLNELLDSEMAAFEQAPDKAQVFLEIGEFPINPQLDLTELAAYTTVANAILNLTESIRKG